MFLEEQETPMSSSCPTNVKTAIEIKNIASTEVYTEKHSMNMLNKNNTSCEIKCLQMGFKFIDSQGLI